MGPYAETARTNNRIARSIGEDADGLTALAALGLDVVRVAVTGAAPFAAEVIEFRGALGLDLNEVDGMSETKGLATVNPRGALRLGTVGVAPPGVEVALSDTGEVLIRGPVITRGYRNRADATADAIDADGRLHSGDVGAIDEDGYLRIVDRIKELIIDATGKNMSSANIDPEGACRPLRRRHVRRGGPHRLLPRTARPLHLPDLDHATSHAARDATRELPKYLVLKPYWK